MALGLIVSLIGAGTGAAWVAQAWSQRQAALEAIGGALLVAGLALLGMALPLAQHFTAG